MILEIATIRIKLTFEYSYNLNTEYINKIVEMYKAEDTADYDFELKTVHPSERPSTLYAMEPRNEALYLEKEDSFVFEKESWVSIINWKEKIMTAMFFGTGEDSHDQLLIRSLKLLVSLLVPQKGGVSCHCSAVSKKNENGLLFCGPSNEGKTTIALLLHRKWTLYNDEYNIIMPLDNCFHVYSTPFTTSEKLRFCSYGFAPVKKIFFLKKGAETKVESMTPKQKYLSVLENTYTFPTSGKICSAMMGNVEKISREIPAGMLYFKLGSDICEEIEHFI